MGNSLILLAAAALTLGCAERKDPSQSSALRSQQDLFVSEDPALTDIIHRSVLHSEHLPSITIAEQTYPYDPLLMSVVANVASRLPALHKQDARQIHLPSQTDAQACSDPITAYLYWGKSSERPKVGSDSPHLPHPPPPAFILLPGFFASWQTGAYFNKIVSVLSTLYPRYMVITLDGMLSPSFLASSCSHLPWNMPGLAKNIYHRLDQLITTLDIAPTSTGLIGFSGGGALAFHLLAYGADQERALFQKGAFIGSPVLDFELTFRILDEAARSIPHSRTLVSYDYVASLVPRFMRRGKIQIYPEDILAKYQNNPEDFRQRALNQFHPPSPQRYHALARLWAPGFPRQLRAAVYARRPPHNG